ncbi:MAG: SBBP repeat-containing protein, partial [Saprospiraceae bacterium]|nr:SBBP repeat-containing protein [Saprospiraceae bacterium]
MGQGPNLTWAKKIGGSNDDNGTSIAIDGIGNVYSAGFFSGAVDFDPGPGVFNLSSIGADNTFISKLDASGNFVWAKKLGGGTSSVFGLSIGLDNSGNVFVTGNFFGTGDFDPGPGVSSLTSLSGSSDIFITKLDNNGSFVWVKQIGGITADKGYALALDASGNVYTSGFFNGNVDFDPGPGIVNMTAVSGSPEIFVLKLDVSGNFLWAKQMGGNGPDEAWSIAMAADGSVLTTGYFSETADFDPGPGIVNLSALSGDTDIFVSKLNSSGDFIWARQFVGSDNDAGYSVATDALGNVYTTGIFNGTVDFDPGIGTYNLTAPVVMNIFISKLDATGNFVWAKIIETQYISGSNAITTDALSNVYITGYFVQTADFDPGPGVNNLAAAGAALFILKLDATGNFVWSTKMGEVSAGVAGNSLAVKVDNGGNIFTTGYFTGSADFDPCQGVFNLNSNGGEDIFISKLNQNVLCINNGCITPGTPVAVTGTGTGPTTASLDWASGSPVGSATVTYYWVVGTSPTVTYGNGVAQGSTTGFWAGATGLSPGTIYYLRVYATTSCDNTSSGYGTSYAFITTGYGICTTPGTPVSVTGTATGPTTASLDWAAGNPVGSPTVTYYWVVGTSPAVTYGNGVAQGSTTGFWAGATGLSPGTIYYLRVFASTSCNNTSSGYG